MTSQMTAAQAAQQSNRHDDGRYAEKHLADPGQILSLGAAGHHPDLAAWDGVDIPAPADGQTFTDGSPVRAGDFSTAYADFLAPLDEWEQAHHCDYVPQLTQDRLALSVGMDPSRLNDITSRMRFEAHAAGVRVFYPSGVEATFTPIDSAGYEKRRQLDMRASLRDRIRTGELPPWTILSPNPDMERWLDAEHRKLEGDLRTFTRRADDWDAAIATGEQVLAEAAYKPAKEVGWYSDQHLEPSHLVEHATSYKRRCTDLAAARDAKAAAASEVADFTGVLEQHPELSDLVRETLAKGRKQAEHSLQSAETDERSSYRQMREHLAHLVRRLPLAAHERGNARTAAQEAAVGIEQLKVRRAWDLSWPGSPSQVPARPEL